MYGTVQALCMETFSVKPFCMESFRTEPFRTEPFPFCMESFRTEPFRTEPFKDLDTSIVGTADLSCLLRTYTMASQ